MIERFHFLSQAQSIFENDGEAQLEIEARMLARQKDSKIGLAMGLPPPTVQAYRYIFFAVEDRIDATSIIVRQVIAIRETEVSTVPQMKRLCERIWQIVPR